MILNHLEAIKLGRTYNNDCKIQHLITITCV